ncbi:cytochrome c oxidase assembly protein [Pseudorhizobium flavum]|uniref:Putative membrane protein n=1 Tax=Pseudorhizobium flavum TaxID=1335061 RepID=A0A7W9YYB9_9HYPH|nr:cytochrome c oxidase assembly protein [Pseudorhizobium flavum]MBB6180585.1 putative membrane protein [Pseudorhizobium flavum]CAD6615937.1 cytochrome-c oxidase [Pseudorhizobium flavum]
MRRASLATGLLLLAVAWIIVLPFGGRESFTIHMIVHMSVVAGAAPLLAVGLSGFRHDLTVRWPWFTPVIASLVELVAVWGWHLPAARVMAEASWIVTALEQATFLAAGLLLWLSCLGGAQEGREARQLAGTFGLLFTSMHMTLLGALLSLSPRPLYGIENVTCFGVTLGAAVDQQAGGVVMLLVGAVVYLLGGVLLLSSALGPREHSGGRL